MLKIYKSPEGAAFWYEEGEQPEGYVLAERKASKPANKAKAPANKARKVKGKENA